MLANQVLETKNFFARGRGLLGRSSLADDTVMWIVPCNNIHTWFMQFPIDVAFVDKDLVICAVIQNLRPFRMVWPIWRAHSVFEFNGGVLQRSLPKLGDRFYVGA